MKKIRTIDDITAADWEDIKQRREAGANLDQVGELYGITGTTLARYARLAGVDIPMPSKYSPLPPIEDILRLRAEMLTWADIAQRYSISRGRLRDYARQHGIDTHQTVRYVRTQVDWEGVRKQREEGKTWAEIADTYDVHSETLRKNASSHGIDICPSNFDRINAMLNPDWPGWEEVKQMREYGKKWTEIAEDIGVSTTTLRRLMVHLALRSPTEKTEKYCSGTGGSKAKVLYTQTLCWECANSVPDKSGKRGCAWSRSFKPVPGWDADETWLYGSKRDRRSVQSYNVRQCPEFVRG